MIIEHCALFSRVRRVLRPHFLVPVIMAATVLSGGGRDCVWAQETNDLQETVGEAVSTRQDTQKQLDGWAQEKADLTTRYRSARANVEWLNGRRLQELEKVAALESRIAEMGRRLTEAQRLEGSIQDTLMVILVKLESWVQIPLSPPNIKTLHLYFNLFYYSLI